MKPNKPSAWREFYLAESAFMDAITASSTCLFDNGPDHHPAYHRRMVGNAERLSPPSHISWLGHTHMPKAEFDRELAKLKALYQAARPEKVKRFPSRFPQYFERVEQVNVIENQAFDSQPVNPKAKFFTALSLPPDLTNPHDTQRYKTLLADAGFTVDVCREHKLIGGFTIEMVCFNILTSELFEYAGATAIQIRRPSGKAYRANLRHIGESSANRINLGFVLIDAQSKPRVVKSNPQAPRPHRLVNSNALIKLPIATSFQLFKKA